MIGTRHTRKAVVLAAALACTGAALASPAAAAADPAVILEARVDQAIISDSWAQAATDTSGLGGRTIVSLPRDESVQDSVSWSSSRSGIAPAAVTLNAWYDPARAGEAVKELARQAKGEEGAKVSKNTITRTYGNGASYTFAQGRAVITASCSGTGSAEALRDCAKTLGLAQGVIWKSLDRKPRPVPAPETVYVAEKKVAKVLLSAEAARAATSLPRSTSISLDEISSSRLDAGAITTAEYAVARIAAEGSAPTKAGIQQWGSRRNVSRAWSSLPTVYADGTTAALVSTPTALSYWGTADTGAVTVTTWQNHGAFIATGTCQGGTRANVDDVRTCSEQVASAQARAAKTLLADVP